MMHHLNAKPCARSAVLQRRADCPGCVLPAVLLLAGCTTFQPGGLGTGGAASAAFRSSVDTPPKGWKGPVFKLNANYPKTRPNCDAPWLKRDVNFDDPNPTWEEWAPYIQDIVDLCQSGPGSEPPRRDGLEDPGERPDALVSRAVDGLRRRARARVCARADQRAVDGAALVSRRRPGQREGDPERLPGRSRQPARVRDLVGGDVQPLRRLVGRAGVSAVGGAGHLQRGGQELRTRHALCERHGGDQAAQHHGRRRRPCPI